MWLVVWKYQFSEVSVVGDEDATFAIGDGQDFGIAEGLRVMASYRGNIMS